MLPEQASSPCSYRCCGNAANGLRCAGTVRNVVSDRRLVLLQSIGLGSIDISGMIDAMAQTPSLTVLPDPDRASTTDPLRVSIPVRLAAALLLATGAAPAAAWEPVALPNAVKAKLPAGYIVRVASCSRTLDPPQPICIVVVARPDEGGQPGAAVRKAPARPLLVYRLSGGVAKLIDRNDRIVLRRDEGGQCDPVEDAGHIAIKGRYFTLESGVACGQHWTDFTTFRFDPALRSFVWQNRIFESLRLNSDAGPNAQALVSDGRKVTRADPRHPIRLEAYRPR